MSERLQRHIRLAKGDLVEEVRSQIAGTDDPGGLTRRRSP